MIIQDKGISLSTPKKDIPMRLFVLFVSMTFIPVVKKKSLAQRLPWSVWKGKHSVKLPTKTAAMS